MQLVRKNPIRISGLLLLLLSLIVSPLILAPPASAASSAKTLAIAANTKDATTAYIIDSGVSGPVVMITGGVHGNEPAGYKAADQVKNFTVKKGILIVIPHANQRADAASKRYVSGQKDLNRSFPQSSTEGCDSTLATGIYNIAKKYHVTWVMDMHEGYSYSGSSVGQSLIYYPDPDTTPMAKTILNTVNKTVSSSTPKFNLLKYPVKGSLARSTANYLKANSFIFETCTKDSMTKRVNYHLTAARTLLSKLGMTD